MTEFYLVTGFLGAGKTSFLKDFLPKFKGKNIQVIINEFGKAGVDASLLEDYSQNLQQICGGSIFCTCKLDRFEDALIGCLKESPDAIIVEASGLSDPTNIRQILDRYSLEEKLIYKGCICLVDAVRFHKVLETARVCKKQLMVADVILLNKTDLVAQEETEKLTELIKTQSPFVNVYKTRFGKTEIDIQKLKLVANETSNGNIQRPDITLQKMFLDIDENMTFYELEHFIKLFAEDSARIKGYINLNDSGTVLVDCVGVILSIKKTETKVKTYGLNLLATKGQNLRKSVKSAIAFYPTKVKINNQN